MRRGLLLILSSPSGAGKSTLARRLIAWDDSISFSVSATTRAKRPGEVDGKDYHFVSEATFNERVRRGEMLEHAEVFGNLYGSPMAQVKSAVEGGQDVLFDIDWQGAQQIQNSPLREHVLSVFILPPSIAELRRRLVARATDEADVVAKRMRQSLEEISHWDSYDYVLVNDDLERTFDHLKTILSAERLRRQRQPGLVEFVRTLKEELS